MSRLNELLKKESDWLAREGFGNQLSWQEEGERIYREILQADTENIHYRRVFVRFLLKFVSDLKNRYSNNRKALTLLEEVLAVKPGDVEACYHIGFVHFTETYYEEALSYFEKALKGMGLSDEKKINAILAASICHSRFMNGNAAEELYDEAKILIKELGDPDYRFSTLAQMARAAISQIPDEAGGVYVKASNGSVRNASFTEADEILDTVGRGYYILDMRYGDDPVLHSPEGRANLQRREAELLYEIMHSGSAMKPEVLQERIWYGEGNPQIVKRFISSLRRKLNLGASEPATNLVMTIPKQGYRWNPSKPFYILSIMTGEFERSL